eukprot:7191024-Prymnesium_polylepis.1
MANGQCPVVCSQIGPLHPIDERHTEIGMLWRVMLKYGVPPKLVRMLIAMHKTVNVKFDVDGV